MIGPSEFMHSMIVISTFCCQFRMRSYHFRVKFGLKIANVFFKLTIQFRLIFNCYWCCCLFHHWLVFVLVVSVWHEGTIKSFQLKYCKHVGNQIIIPILKLKIINKLKYRTHSFCIYCQYNKRFIKLLWLLILFFRLWY